MSEDTTPHQLHLFAVEAPARISVSRAGAKVSRGKKANSSTNTSALYANSDRLLRFGRMSTGHSVLTMGAISQASSVRFKNAGRVTSHGELLMLNLPEFHSAAVESSLSQIL